MEEREISTPEAAPSPKEQPDEFLKNNQISFKVKSDIKIKLVWLREYFRKQVPDIGYTEFFRTVFTTLFQLLSTNEREVTVSVLNGSTDHTLKSEIRMLRGRIQHLESKLRAEVPPSENNDISVSVVKEELETELALLKEQLESERAALATANEQLLHQKELPANTITIDSSIPEVQQFERALERRMQGGLSTSRENFIHQIFMYARMHPQAAEHMLYD